MFSTENVSYKINECFLLIFWCLVSNQKILSQEHLYIMQENMREEVVWVGAVGEGWGLMGSSRGGRGQPV